ncbi:MAG: DUF4010 domain-containing protein [Synechococcales bacterium]|nr:DUF4010 domain-containing protein [Synechococcales bacterium]
MNDAIAQLIPPDVFKLCLVLFLSFLIGLEREEQKSEVGRYVFGGVRTYPLIGLIGYSLAFLAQKDLLPVAIGLLVIGGLMALSYWHKMRSSYDAGLTTEMAGLATYLVGPLVYHEAYWVASTLVITSLMLLELKSALEGLVHRFAPADILTLAKFLFLTIVILPILPNQPFGPFQINPFKTWLVVVAVSTLSYGSFLLQRSRQGQGGLLLIALLGGAYSSTVTTVSLAKAAAQDCRPHRYAGAILIASGMMYVRLGLLVNLFNHQLAQYLTFPLACLAAMAFLMGLLWFRRPDRTLVTCTMSSPSSDRNPLELRAAIAFALLFVVILAATHYTAKFLGDRGLYALATILGIADVDPFILGLTQSAGTSTEVTVASIAILIAAASNNCAKGFYALSFADRTTGRQSLFLLLLLAGLGVMPVIWLLQ